MVEEENNNYGDTYNFLLNVSNGYDPYYNYPSDYIYRLEFNKTNPKFSKVYIRFDSTEKFLKTLGLDDSDIREYEDAFSPYYNYYQTDEYTWKEEWLDGYIINYFDPENLNLLSEILKITNPTLRLSDHAEVSEFLYNTYGDKVEDMYLSFGSEMDDCITQRVKDIMISECKDPYKKIGIEEEHYGYLYSTTVANLLLWYRMSQKENEDVDQVLTYWVEKLDSDKDIGFWDELKYNVNCQTEDLDISSINSTFKWSLEKILEDAESKLDENLDFENYLELYNKVNEMGGFGYWISIPNKKIEVRFKKLNFERPYLVFDVYKPNPQGSDSPYSQGSTEVRSANNIEELNLSLFEPELFERYILIQNKLRRLI